MIQRNTIVSGFAWKMLERFGAQGVTFVVSIILARLLGPDVYGTVALITVITSILQVLVEAGFSNALIQKLDADDVDFSTVFWFNIVSCVLLYICLYISAPFIARFYNMGTITPVIRVLGIVILISGVKGIQIAYVSRNLLFKKFFFSTLGGTITAAIVGILMAYMGCGIWAIVIQNIVNQLIDTIILWITVKWRPRVVFSFERFKQLFRFGWKFLVTGLLNQIYLEMRSLIIGKKYTTSDLAFYNKGEQFPKIIGEGSNYSISGVLFPVMSQIQNDRNQLKQLTRKSIIVGSYLTWPCMLGLAACSKSIICLLLTEKWLPAVPYMIVFCVTYAFLPIHTANLSAINAMGRSDVFLVLEVIKKSIGCITILISMQFGVLWIAIGCLASNVISQVINSWPNRKMLKYSYLEQLRDILPSLLLSISMGIIVYYIGLLEYSLYILLPIQIFVGILIYYVGSRLFKIRAYLYCRDIIDTHIMRQKKRKNNS